LRGFSAWSVIAFDRLSCRLYKKFDPANEGIYMSEINAPQFGIRKNLKLVGRTDIAGGGQVVVENGYAYVGHMDPPHRNQQS
jgi:hypothetical protein